MPKKKSSELYDLVASLSKNEAGYFKKFSARHSPRGKLDYITLFNALAGQKSHDDEALAERFKFKNYSRLKNYLYHTVLQALHSYHIHSNSNAQLRKYLSDIELLYGKALYRQCKKLIKKARAIAIRYEKFNVLIDLIGWEVKILQANIELGMLQKNSGKFLAESREAFEKMQNITEFSILYSQVYSLIRTLGPANTSSAKEPYAQIMANRLMKNEKEIRSDYARMLFYHISSVCSFACHLPDREHAFTKQLVNHIENVPVLFEEEKERYLIGLNNYISSSIRTRRYREAGLYISKIRSLSLSLKKQAGANNLAHRVFARTYILELFLYNISGDQAKALNVISDNEVQLKKLQKKINIANIAELYYRIAYTFFIDGQFKRSLAWLNKMLTDKKLDSIHQFNSYGLILNIAIHIELNNLNHARYLVKAAMARQKRAHTFNDLEKDSLACFTEILEAAGKGEVSRKAVYMKYAQQLSRYERKQHENIFLYYFSITCWLRSKIQKMPLADAIREANPENK